MSKQDSVKHMARTETDLRGKAIRAAVFQVTQRAIEITIKRLRRERDDVEIIWGK